LEPTAHGRDARSPGGGGKAGIWLALRLVLVLTFTAVAGWQLWPYMSWTPADLAAHKCLSDDAFFYSVLACNYQRFGFLTTDGEMPTNGVQPLWIGVQLGLTHLFPDSDEVSVLSRASWSAYVIFSFLILCLASRGSHLSGAVRVVLVAGLVVNNTRFQDLTVTGLEVPLTLAVIAGMLLYLDWAYGSVRPCGPNRREWVRTIVLGVLVSLCFFGRTDLFWIVPAMAIWVWNRSAGRRRSLLIYASTVTLLVLPYLACNWVWYGSPMPISGRVKMYNLRASLPTWDAYWDSAQWHGLFTAFNAVMPPLSWPVLIAGVLALLVLTQIAVWAPRSRSHLPDSLKYLGVALLAHVAFMYGFYRSLPPYTAYYFAPEVVLTAVIAAFLIASRWPVGEHVSATGRRVRHVLGALAAVAVLTCTSAQWRPKSRPLNDYWVPRVALARRIPKLLPDTERIGAFWPGAIAHFSGMPTVPMDGIVGSNDYFQNYVKTGREIEYLLERGVRHLVVHCPKAPIILFRTKPVPTSWAREYLVRLWRYRHRLRTVAHEPRGVGRGWYLFEITGHD